MLGECGLVVPEGAPPLPSDISAGAWLIADLDTGQVLAAKDPHGRYRPASTLKLLTVQPLLKNLTNLDQVVEGTQNDADQDGTRVGIEAGGQYTVRQLLTYLIIISGNDAANALARTNGGYDKTVADMNATANTLGALDTRAATVSGLDGPGQSTSAYDLALFAKADMATPIFPEIVSSVDVKVPAADGDGYIAANDNQLLYQYPGALGGKTGFTDDAGNTYVGMASQNGRRLVVTMMHGTQQPRRQWMQGASLLDWGFALPATTPPVGKLVGSLAEATAATAQPTVSTGVPASASPSGGALAGTADGSAEPTSGSAAEPTSSTSGAPTATIVLAGIGVLIVVLGVLLLLRRRHLNKRPVFAGDAKLPAARDDRRGAAHGSAHRRRSCGRRPAEEAPAQEAPAAGSARPGSAHRGNAHRGNARQRSAHRGSPGRRRAGRGTHRTHQGSASRRRAHRRPAGDRPRAGAENQTLISADAARHPTPRPRRPRPTPRTGSWSGPSGRSASPPAPRATVRHRVPDLPRPSRSRPRRTAPAARPG